MFAESGADSFYVDSTRDRTPSGSCHHWQIHKLTINEMRRQHRRTTKRLIERVRRDGELVGKLWAVIDVTKGAPFTGDMETDEEDNVVEPYILGHRDGNYYHQWTSIQIVGHDIPLVLDALPKERGMTKDEIVDKLLEHATDMIDDTNLGMTGREFDSDPVKDICVSMMCTTSTRNGNSLPRTHHTGEETAEFERLSGYPIAIRLERYLVCLLLRPHVIR